MDDRLEIVVQIALNDQFHGALRSEVKVTSAAFIEKLCRENPENAETAKSEYRKELSNAMKALLKAIQLSFDEQVTRW